MSPIFLPQTGQLTDGASFKPAVSWQSDDGYRLLQILLSLAALHSERRPSGNITGQSLKRDQNGRLLLELDFQAPSKCKESLQAAPESRFFVHVNQQPKEADDLVGLGVAFAEILVKNKPSITGNDVKYRDDLRDEIKKLKNKVCDHYTRDLVADLLGLQHNGGLATSQFLKQRVGLLELAQASDRYPILRPVTWGSLFFHFPKWHSAPIASVLAALVFTALGVLWQLDRLEIRKLGEHITLRDARIAELKDQVGGLNWNIGEKDKQIGNLNKKIGELSAQLGKSPDEPAQMVDNWIEEHPVYKMFGNNIAIQKNERFQELVPKSKKPMLTPAESNEAERFLKDLVEASKIWWGMVATRGLSSQQIKQKIEAQDGTIKWAINKWYAQVMDKHTYRIRLDESATKAPSNYEGFEIRMWLRSSGDSIWHDRRFRIQEGKFVSIESEKSYDLDVAWKSGDMIEVAFEYWTYTLLNWRDIKEYQIEGDFAPLVLGTYNYPFSEFKVRFSVNPPGVGRPLPGPPIESMRSGATFPDINHLGNSSTPTIDHSPTENHPVSGDTTIIDLVNEAK